MELRVATIPTRGRSRGRGVADPGQGRGYAPPYRDGDVAAQFPGTPGDTGQALRDDPLRRPHRLRKTTTLHAALHEINRPDRKIWTAEDPVEITQYGLRQVQVQSKIGFDFAAAMRAFCGQILT